MKVDKICQIRQISIIDVSTPLIVPSFSSRGFPNLKRIYEYTKQFVPDVSLLSSYDLYYHFLDKNIYSSDLMFIDSGGYETQSIQSTFFGDDIYSCKSNFPIKEWNYDLHKKVLNKLENNSQFVFVNHDDWKAPKSILNQIETAVDFFNEYPSVASDFLVKPETFNEQYINVNKLIDYVDSLNHFSILGITEKELGASILDRCYNIFKIRSALNEKKISIPIHIFGCLTPELIITYFLCGADIFDGLAWLRYSFHELGTFYPGTAILFNQEWNYSEPDLFLAYSIRNLRQLESLSREMKKFANSNIISEFSYSNFIIDNIIKLVKKSGIEIED
jgi:hypothetical protein